MKIIFCLICVFAFNNAYTQFFVVNINKCDSLQESGLYIDAIKCIKENESNDYISNRKIANCYGKLNELDSTMKYLNILLKYGDVDMTLLEMESFDKFKNSPEWKHYEDTVFTIFKNKNPMFNREYYNILLKLSNIYIKNSNAVISERYSNGESKKTDSLRVIMNILNLESLDTLEKYIELFGWPYSNVVTSDRAFAAIKIISYSNKIDVLKKYFKYFQEDVNRGNTSIMQTTAEIEDKILIADGKKQKYGSQVFYNEKAKIFEFYPIEDLTKVDSLRKGMGFYLNLEDYLNYLNSGTK